MELRGVIEGLKLLKEPCQVEVISDSSYVVNAINSWLPGWIARGFKKVKNVDLWKEYITFSEPHDIVATWVKGHSGHPQNERCDTLAVNEALKYQAKQNAKGK
jgi:ribonuclease HI